MRLSNELVQNSVLLNSAVSDNDNENSVFFHYLYGVVQENGHNAVIKLIVEEQETPSQGSIKRAYKLVDIKKYQPSAEGSGKALAFSQIADNIRNISQPYDYVKQNDPHYLF